MARSYFVPAPKQTGIPFAYPAIVDAPLVLCVDDDPEILELLEDVLTACGIRVLCTTDCITALKLVATEPVDLVVLDYQMPQMNGLALARELRSEKSNVPMILFSGAMLPCEALEIVSRVINKGAGALHLADAILETIRTPV